MATTNTTTFTVQEVQKQYSQLLADKIDEVREKIKFYKSDACTLSDNTKSTQLYQRNKELKTLRVIEQLLNGKIDASGKETLTSLVTLVSERAAASTFEVKEGDNISDLLQANQDVKDFGSKLLKKMAKLGLTVDYANGGKIVKITK